MEGAEAQLVNYAHMSVGIRLNCFHINQYLRFLFPETSKALYDPATGPRRALMLSHKTFIIRIVGSLNTADAIYRVKVSVVQAGLLRSAGTGIKIQQQQQS